MITLETLAEATPQQVFDQVANHLFEQKEPSYSDEHQECRYRSRDRNERLLMCAAGCLLSESDYKESMEGHGWAYLTDHDLIPRTQHTELIHELQKAHDSVEDAADWSQEAILAHWRENLRGVAQRFNLDTKVLDTHRAFWTEFWGISYNGEIFDHTDFPSREEAIAEGRASTDDVFYVGQFREPVAPEELFNAEEWLETVDSNDDYCNDFAGGWCGATPEQLAKLNKKVRKVMAQWLNKHGLRPTFRLVDNPERIEPEDA